MNDYLTAISTIEMTRNRPASTSTYRPRPSRRKASIGPRIAALLRGAPRRSAAPAPA